MGHKWPSVSLCSMFLLADVATTQTMLISTHWCPLSAQLISSHISFISIQLQTILVIFFQMEKSKLDPVSPNISKTQTLLFKLVSSQAGQLGIKDTNAAPPGGTFLRNITEDRRRKNPAPGGNWTHDLSVTRHTVYRCATTTARGSPNLRRPFQLLDRPQRPQNLWRFIPGINFDFGRY